MLALTAPSKSSSSGNDPRRPRRSRRKAKPLPASDAAGNWKAEAPGGGTVQLALGSDGRFTWKYSHANKSQPFDGKYELAGTTLVLDYSNGGTMVGRINAEGQNQFSFKMIGGPQSDPGLTFSK